MISASTLRMNAFARLSSEDVAAIAAIGRSTRTIGARRDLIHEGESPRYAHLFLEGWASRYKTLPDGRRQIVSFVLPGDFCNPNVELLRKMDHSIGAITRLSVVDFSTDDMVALTRNHPQVARALEGEELVDASIQREWTVNVGQRTAYERVAHLMLELFYRLAAVGRTKNQSCDFPLTQTDLAEATGLTAVHVNRTLQDIRQDGLLVLERRRLTIPDTGAMAQAALFNPAYLHLDQQI